MVWYVGVTVGCSQCSYGVDDGEVVHSPYYHHHLMVWHACVGVTVDGSWCSYGVDVGEVVQSPYYHYHLMVWCACVGVFTVGYLLMC